MIKKITLILLIASTLGASAAKLHRYGSWRHGVHFFTEDRFQFYITWMYDFFQWQNDEALINLGITKYKHANYTTNPEKAAREIADIFDYKIIKDKGKLPNVKKGHYFLCKPNNSLYDYAFVGAILDDRRQQLVEILVDYNENYSKKGEEITRSFHINR